MQGKYDGYDTDDLIVFTESLVGNQKQKIVGQIKHSVAITSGNSVFRDVIRAAWNDFNDPRVFSKNKDVLVLITGPLSATDINDVRPLLDWARHSENAADFVTKVRVPDFSSDGKREKLEAFRVNLKNANGGKDLSDDELFSFLRHFHLLGYDLDIKSGVVLSLLHSLIGQYTPDNAANIWARIVTEVQANNKDAGIITVSSLPADLRAVFKDRVEKKSASVSEAGQVPARNWNSHQDAADLVIASLIGSWNEKSAADVAIVEKLSKKSFSQWIARMQEVLQLPDSPLKLNNGVWAIIDRRVMWEALGARVFDSHLDAFKECAVKILGERDPKFELPPEERFYASMREKVLSHSNGLRSGVSETLALLGSSNSALTRCSLGKAEGVAVLVIRELFENSDFVVWGGLNPLLPVLAEAAPGEFLGAVNNAIKRSPCPFDTLFKQEGSGVAGTNYLTGLLWALENLAWDNHSIVDVTVVLGKLATHDPGGNWANRPSSSLRTIFLPWYPQTTASLEKRKVAVQTLTREVPVPAWKLLVSLLPSVHQSSFGAHKPKWRNPVPDDWKPKVTESEYLDQVRYYSELAVEAAAEDIDKLAEIVSHFGNLPKTAFEKLLSVLSSKTILEKPEEERLILWEALADFALKHHRYADAEWAMPSEFLAQVEIVAKSLAPKNPVCLHHRLFNSHISDFFEENGNWQEQEKRIRLRRQEAIKDILSFGGISAVIEFATKAKYPQDVGTSLGVVAGTDIDANILPGLLTADNAALKQFASGFIWARFRDKGWGWGDSLDIKSWTLPQITQFLAWLPATDETWKRVTALLKEQEKEYWSLVSVWNPYQIEGDIVYAIDKLTEHGRPKAAIGCLYRMLHDKKPIDPARAIKALQAATSSDEPAKAMELYDAAKLIEILQAHPESDKEAVSLIEWLYLPILERETTKAYPKILEHKLASDPKFFCEMISLVYRSEKETETPEAISEQKKQVAANAYHLLSNWRTMPGLQSDGGFVSDQFTRWLETVKNESAKTGHLEVALIHIGGVIYRAPKSGTGIGYDKAVLDVLNAEENGPMRNGFRTEMYNSRGVHWVDPSGKQELDLATQYKKQAEELENAGYQRIAGTFRGLGDSYESEAKRVIAEHKDEV